MGAAVEQVAAPFRQPVLGVHHAEQAVHEQGRPVGHGSVDDLPLARAAAFEERGDHTECEQHAAAAEVADEIERRHRPSAFFADGVQGRGQRDVVDVVPGRVCHGAGLSPAGHAPVDERRVPFEADIGTETQALHDAGSKTFDQYVVALDELEYRLHAAGILQVDGDAPASARQHIGAAGGLAGGAGTVHAHDLGAHIRQHHAAERPGPDALQFDHFESREWSHGCFPRLSGRLVIVA